MQSQSDTGGQTAAESRADRKALTVDEFCDAYRLSRSSFYKLRKLGRAPRTMTVLSRTLISVEAANEWQRTMETRVSGPMQVCVEAERLKAQSETFGKPSTREPSYGGGK